MGKSHGKQTFATTKEINSCVNQNQTSRFESVEIKTLHKIKKTQNKESKNHFSRCKESKKSERITFQTSESTKNQNFKVQIKMMNLVPKKSSMIRTYSYVPRDFHS